MGVSLAAEDSSKQRGQQERLVGPRSTKEIQVAGVGQAWGSIAGGVVTGEMGVLIVAWSLLGSTGQTEAQSDMIQHAFS